MDNFTKKILTALFVASSLLCVWLLNENSKLQKKVEVLSSSSSDSLQHKLELISSEIFVKETIIQRYDIALDMLKDEDSLCGAKFEKILYTETE